MEDGITEVHETSASKKNTGNWKACSFILVNQCFERLAFYGMSTNLVNYLHDQFGQDNATAAKNVNTWMGTCNFTPLLGAFLDDSYLGRYRTIAGFSCIYVIGVALLTTSAIVPGLKPSCDANACHPTSGQTAASFIALYLIAFGAGGMKPCVSSFGADQFDDNDETEKKKKSSFFNWLYLSINLGAVIGSSVLIWIQMNMGWGWGFGVPAAAMIIAIISFFVGSPWYRHQIPGGSPITRICQVIVAAVKKGGLKVPDEKSLYETADSESNIKGSRKLEHSNDLKCLDRAAVETETDQARAVPNPWSLCTVTQVEELESVLRILPIWASLIAFATVFSQMSTTFVLQGNTMDLHIGPNFKVPSVTLSLFDHLSVLFWAPVYDRIIVPLARRYTGHRHGFTQLQRIGIGLVISIISMIMAGILEVVRLDIVRKNNYYDRDTIPMSIFWQVPQYFLIGATEVFTSIGQMEFFYGEAPDAMRSLLSALSLTTDAFGNYVSTFLVVIVTKITTRNGNLGWIPDNMNRGRLDYFFWLITVLSVINFLVYLWIAKRYTYKKVSTNTV